MLAASGIWDILCTLIGLKIKNVRKGVAMKTTKVFCIVASLALVICLVSKPSAASVVTSQQPGWNVLAMAPVEYFGPGPQTTLGGATWTSTNATSQGGSVFGYTGGYGFAGNGYWNAAMGPMAGVNDSFDAWGVTDTMTFALASPVSTIGGWINYVPGGSTPTTIAVYDASMNPIESYNLTFVLGNGFNLGEWLGFQESTADISYFTLTDNYIGITESPVSATPLPGALLLFGPGLAGLAVIRRRFRK